MELKAEFIAMLDREIVLVEACRKTRVNEVRQDASSALEELKETVLGICES